MSLDNLKNDAALLLGLSQLEPANIPSSWKPKEEHFEAADREPQRISKQEKRNRSKSYGSPLPGQSHLGALSDLNFSSLTEAKHNSEFNNGGIDRLPKIVRTNSASYTKKRKRGGFRATRACTECHRRKVRCLPNADGNMRPCQACIRSGVADFCRNHVPTSRATSKSDGKHPDDPNSGPRPQRPPKALADHLNRHRGLPCTRNSWCDRPFKHPGHCRNPHALKIKRTRKRSKATPEMEDFKPPVGNANLLPMAPQIMPGSAEAQKSSTLG
eukprot:CAMPEP_0167774168 /NCGR_PEP_ID=MMETSP0111_2-20121227/1844_1 /TAXON_ID=91324 /ORGANISM="Lotharella globosa, Strain CCCM811" /LENGTH=270 /DNA_ID=CAMNT_0007663923 /DNA_START=198 /DNA_END=1010 /DNA_ORIENTATION=-